MSRLLRFACAMVVTTGLCAAGALAQQQGSQAGQGQAGQGGPQAGMRHGDMNVSPQERAERMSRMLNLNEEQKTKLTGILEQQQKQMQDIRNDSSLSEQDKRSKMQEAHQWTTAQIRGILNPEQLQKLDKMEERMKERREKGGQGQAQPKQ